jgi:hypothetical protein
LIAALERAKESLLLRVISLISTDSSLTYPKIGSLTLKSNASNKRNWEKVKAL